MQGCRLRSTRRKIEPGNFKRFVTLQLCYCGFLRVGNVRPTIEVSWARLNVSGSDVAWLALIGVADAATETVAKAEEKRSCTEAA